MTQVLPRSIEDIFSLERLFHSWTLFKRGKRARPDVQLFERHLERNIFELPRLLMAGEYGHSARPFQHGIDFLGTVLLPHHRVLRSKTRRRIFRRLARKMEALENGGVTAYDLSAAKNSYLAHLEHVNGYSLTAEISNQFCVLEP